MDHVFTDRIDAKLANVDNFFSRDVAMFKQRLAELDSQIDPAAKPHKNDAMHRRVLDAFEHSQLACCRFEAENGDDLTLLRDVQRGFRQETAYWFNRSWIGHRSRTKPSGFAGDFDMLIKLYEESTPALGLGGYLDLCILDLPLARAVRARLKAAQEFLIRDVQSRVDNVRILNIACGPCREYLAWPRNCIYGNVEVIAMDNDPQALAYAEAHVVGSVPGKMQLRPTRYNALRTRSANATIRKFGKFDIIYSVGLFDYLSDDQLIPILGALRETLTDSGVMYIAFKDTMQYDKTPYQWHLDWFFYQRTEQDCLRLYESAGIPSSAIGMSRDDTGIIMNFVNYRPSQSFVRAHLPENVLNRLGDHLPLAANLTPKE